MNFVAVRRRRCFSSSTFFFYFGSSVVVVVSSVLDWRSSCLRSRLGSHCAQSWFFALVS